LERNLNIVIDVTQLVESRADTGIERVVRKVVQEAFKLEKAKPVLVAASWGLGLNRFEIVSIDRVRSNEGNQELLNKVYGSIGYKGLTNLRFWLQRKRLNFLAENPLSVFLAHLFITLMKSRVGGKSAKFYSFSHGDVLVLPGAFWNRKTLRLARHASKSGAKLAVIVNDVTPLSHPQYCDALNRRNFTLFANQIVQLSSWVLYPSNHTKTQLETFWPGILEGKKTKKLNYGYDSLKIDPSKLLSGRIPNSICVLGTVEPRKNHEIILDWFMEFADPRTTLTFIGQPGWLTEAFQERLIQQTQVNSSLRWLKALTDEEVAGELALHELGILASHEEGFGLPVIEMSAAGLKLVLSDIPIFREVAGGAAEYFDRNSITALNEAIVRARKTDRPHAIKPKLWKDTATELFEFIS
jgi:glycosyltransferase involved in cell wall biosynthesis